MVKLGKYVGVVGGVGGGEVDYILYSVNEWGYGWSLGDKIWGFVGDVGV